VSTNDPTDEEALDFLIEYLRRDLPEKRGHRPDFTLMVVGRAYLKTRKGLDYSHQNDERAYELTGPIGNAAWCLVRLGVLRPGGQYFAPGAPFTGMEFTLTDFGRAWILRPLDELVFASPERTSRLLDRYRARFGDAYLQRGIEAADCYRAGLYLACCAMCGAASEAIVLALAREQMSKEEVDAVYLSSGGRGRLRTRVLGKCQDSVRRRFAEYSDSLDFWRDYAAHGRSAPIGEPEAFRSMQLLVRLAQFTDEHLPQGQKRDTHGDKGE
jgi:hypothetical protein